MDEQTERIRRINHRGANTSNYNFFGFDLLHSALKFEKGVICSCLPQRLNQSMSLEGA